MKKPNIIENTSESSVSTVRAALLDGLVAETMDAVRAAPRTRDTIYGDFSSIVSMARSVAYRESTLLERGLDRLLSAAPHLQVLKAHTPMPIVGAALELLKHNNWSALSALRLDSEVFYTSTYKPDHLVFNQNTAELVIIDQKRNASLLSLPELRMRMMAAGLTAADWLYHQGYNLHIEHVQIAIVDCSDGKSNPDSGVFGLSDIDRLFRTEGVGQALMELRAELAQEVQLQLREACLQVVEHPICSASDDAEPFWQLDDSTLKQQGAVENTGKLRRPKRLQSRTAYFSEVCER